jgi:hypothetical protein
VQRADRQRFFQGRQRASGLGVGESRLGAQSAEERVLCAARRAFARSLWWRIASVSAVRNVRVIELKSALDLLHSTCQCIRLFFGDIHSDFVHRAPAF